jgi:hypothetical protein
VIKLKHFGTDWLGMLYNALFLFFLAASAVLAAVGLYAASRGEMPRWVGIYFAFLTVVFFLMFVQRPGDLRKHVYVDELEVSAWGVRRIFGPRWRAKKVEAVAWDALCKVDIETNDLGPGAEDMFFLLHGADGTGVLVSNALAVKHRLLEELQRRLPGFDNGAVVEASGCTTNAVFVAWRRTDSRSEHIGHGGRP